MIRIGGLGFKGWFLTDFELENAHVPSYPIAAARNTLGLQSGG
jgi:hypothetical protein